MKDSAPSKIDERYSGALGKYFDEVEGYIVRRYLDHLGNTILDLGCGTGRFLPLLVSAGKQLAAIDLFLPDLKIASHKNKLHGKQALLICGDATALPLPGNCIDAIIAMGIFQFTDNLEPFLNELQRISKPEGKLIFSVWNKPAMNFPGCISIDSHQRQHTATSVKASLNRFGFHVETIEYTFFMPRRLFWWGYRLAGLLRMHKYYLAICTWIEKTLRENATLKTCGWEMLVVAKKECNDEAV